MWKIGPIFLLLLAATRFNAQSTVQPAEERRILTLEMPGTRQCNEKT